MHQADMVEDTFMLAILVTVLMVVTAELVLVEELYFKEETSQLVVEEKLVQVED
jgi:hypothetical protein